MVATSLNALSKAREARAETHRSLYGTHLIIRVLDRGGEEGAEAGHRSGLVCTPAVFVQASGCPATVFLIVYPICPRKQGQSAGKTGPLTRTIPRPRGRAFQLCIIGFLYAYAAYVKAADGAHAAYGNGLRLRVCVCVYFFFFFGRFVAWICFTYPLFEDCLCIHTLCCYISLNEEVFWKDSVF